MVPSEFGRCGGIYTAQKGSVDRIAELEKRLAEKTRLYDALLQRQIEPRQPETGVTASRTVRPPPSWKWALPTPDTSPMERLRLLAFVVSSPGGRVLRDGIRETWGTLVDAKQTALFKQVYGMDLVDQMTEEFKPLEYLDDPDWQNVEFLEMLQEFEFDV